MRRALTALLCLAALPASAEGFGLAGVLSAKNRQDLPPIALSAGMPLADAPLVLKSGTYYEIEIIADGSAELALTGPEFFRAIWIDEIVIEGLEIRPLGLDSVEFDEAGTMEIGFLAIKPGRYVLQVPGVAGDLMRLEVSIE
ncbi:hypothetical protein [Albimonas pacifica]|uniref:MSP domain-containing protein n=1 Tax=Albimonas pacifica TaxID=1114924 RepID=A0A1I3IGX9_9RHOB|nr:hypothetical protein [Albimonas pacifica]SFI47150.1 hypothetical protein SAMN05216258_10746 [Albimonas pacifica]